ncbi:head decoration protein [Gluconacetobacter diazotrophicus]|uniref:Head decoration protein n=1 Tax=Gluconacetobacter diazotrophicus TaxID=33996 RepID=A0A7W4I6M0_GLUDI|nr:head decoration protein [Gluconacetobacter diazotrophicus]MBB2157206.1 head decoration protein [Gluconacetobacter diazotrophicus]
MSETTSGYGFLPGARSTLFVPDQLIAGNLKLVTDTVTIGASQTLIRGAVLGRVTATGEYILSVATATDGSQNPAAILVDNVTTAAGATQTAGVYLQGEFNSNYLTFDPSWTVATLTPAMRPTIFIKTALSGDPV